MSYLGTKALGALGQELGKEAAKHILAKAGIKDSLTVMSKQLTGIQEDINRLTAQVGSGMSGILDIRKDLHEKTVIKITHPFNSVNMVIAQSLATQDKNEMAKCHARLTELLTDCRKDVSEALFTLDQKLSSTEKGNITRAAVDQAWTDSTDFVSFLLKMKAFIEPLWLAEAQALLLIQMATQDPNVIYPEGLCIISKYDGDKGKLSVQEAVFEEMVGSSTIKLYDALVASPRDGISITFQTFSKVIPTIKLLSVDMGNNRHRLVEQASLSGSTSVQWELICQGDLSQPDPKKIYIFGIGFRDEVGIFKYLVPSEERVVFSMHSFAMIAPETENRAMLQWSGAFSIQWVGEGPNTFLTHSTGKDDRLSLRDEPKWEDHKYIWRMNPCNHCLFGTGL